MADYLVSKYGFVVLSSKALLQAILKANKKPANTHNLQRLGNELIAKVGGEGFMVIMLENLPEGNYVIDAIRQASASAYLRSHYGDRFIHIHMNSKEDVRQERFSQREGANLQEIRRFDSAPTESENSGLGRISDFKLSNNSSLTNLHAELDKILRKVGLGGGESSGKSQLENDSTTPPAFLKGKIAKFNSERKWDHYLNPKDLAIAISVESSELLDLFKWRKTRRSARVPPARLSQVKDEMADVMIYLMSLANVLSIDLTGAVLQKMSKNALKYPKHKDLTT